ncbi:MAG: DUF3291 domain-containing protein [Pseudomonadota bacterium]
MTHHLASFNLARSKGPKDDPIMASFFAQVDRMNALAERMPGFIWRNTDEGNFSEGLAEDPLILSTLSVWEDVSSLHNYVFNTIHRQMYDRRHEWFEVFDGPYMVFWNVSEGHKPAMSEGFGKLDHITEFGPTAAAFDWAWLESTKVR